MGIPTLALANLQLLRTDEATDDICTIHTWVVLNPHWNKRLAHDNSRANFRLFIEDLLDVDGINGPIVKGLKSDRFYFTTLSF